MDSSLFFLIALFVGLASLIIWPKLVTRVAMVQMLGDESRETMWVNLKKQILVTSVYTNEASYERLYSRCSELLTAFMMRHQHYVMGIEAKWGERGNSEISEAFLAQEREHTAAARYYCINANLNLQRSSDDLIFYACWFAYVGGQSKYVPGQIMSDRRFLRNAIDYLINERNSIEAVFFKGFVLKYGPNVYSKPNGSAARKYLERAARGGVGAAAQELQYLDKHMALESVESVHVQDDIWE